MFSLFNRKPAKDNRIERYEASIASKDETIERICKERDRAKADVQRERETIGRQIETIRKLRTERDEALAKIQRMTGGLSKGTAAAVAKRKAASQQPA